jgi:pimeloyl-ACP methyl ester carboxylesterase
MLGCSFGGVIGLHVAVQHPGQISTLIVHEPVAPWLLPSTERARHEQELADLQEVYRTGGLPAAFPEIARVLGIDTTSQDVESDLTAQPMTPQRITNFDVFIKHDFAAAMQDILTAADIAALAETRIVPAAGRTTPRTVFDYRCAQELAALLGTSVTEFPGGHNGNTTHPAAYANQLRRALQDAA